MERTQHAVMWEREVICDCRCVDSSPGEHRIVDKRGLLTNTSSEMLSASSLIQHAQYIVIP